MGATASHLSKGQKLPARTLLVGFVLPVQCLAHAEQIEKTIESPFPKPTDSSLKMLAGRDDGSTCLWPDRLTVEPSPPHGGSNAPGCDFSEHDVTLVLRLWQAMWAFFWDAAVTRHGKTHPS